MLSWSGLLPPFLLYQSTLNLLFKQRHDITAGMLNDSAVSLFPSVCLSMYLMVMGVSYEEFGKVILLQQQVRDGMMATFGCISITGNFLSALSWPALALL